MRLFLIITFLSFSSVSFSADSKKTCDSYDILNSICDYFEIHKDKPHIKTSDGGFILNPNYAKTTEVEKKEIQKIFSDKEANLDFAHVAQKAMEFEISAEDTFESGKKFGWTRASKRILTSASNLARILASAYPKDKKLDWIRKNTISAPKNRRDPKSKVITYSEDQIGELINEIGPEKIKKLRKKYDELYPQSVKVGDSQEVELQGFRFESLPMRKESLEQSRIRQKSLFLHAKSSIIKMIKAGREPNELTEEQKILIARVEKVKLSFADTPISEATQACKEFTANASFDPISETVFLCKNSLDLPNTALLKLIGHEIGHSVDPCAASCSHMKINISKLKNFKITQEINPELKEEFESLKKRLNVSAESIDYFTFPDSFSDELHEFLKKNEIITYSNPPIKLENQTFDSVKRCLVQNNQIDDISEQDIDIAVKLNVDNYKRMGIPVDNSTYADLKSQFSKKAICSGIGIKTSEVNEAMADLYGNFALREYLKENPPKSASDIAGIDAFTVTNACSSSLTQQITTIGFSGLSLLNNSHPIHQIRATNLTFEFPGISDYYSCDLKPQHNCFKIFEDPRNTSNSRDTSTSGGTK